MNKIKKTLIKKIVLMAAAMPLLAGGIYQLSAQNAPAAAPVTISEAASPSAANAEANSLAKAGEFHIGSDPTVWILIVLFNLALAISIERLYVLYKNRGRNDALVSLITEELHKGGDAAKLTEKTSEKSFGSEGRVATVTLKGWGDGIDSMTEYSEAAMIAERRLLAKRLGILSTLGNNTPFIGLLGTVLGIMKAFRDLASMGDAGTSVVMHGISAALIATAFGLGVAIPCVIAYNYFMQVVDDKLADTSEIVKIIKAIKLKGK